MTKNRCEGIVLTTERALTKSYDCVFCKATLRRLKHEPIRFDHIIKYNNFDHVAFFTHTGYRTESDYFLTKDRFRIRL